MGARQSGAAIARRVWRKVSHLCGRTLGRKEGIDDIDKGYCSLTRSRTTAWAHNDWQAMTNPSITRFHVFFGFAVLPGPLGGQQDFVHHP